MIDAAPERFVLAGSIHADTSPALHTRSETASDRCHAKVSRWQPYSVLCARLLLHSTQNELASLRQSAERHTE